MRLFGRYLELYKEYERSDGTSRKMGRTRRVRRLFSLLRITHLAGSRTGNIPIFQNGIAGSALTHSGKGLKLVSCLAITACGSTTLPIILSLYCTVPRARSDGCTPSKSRRVRNPPRRRRSRIEGAMVKLQISVRAIAGAIGGTFIMVSTRFVTGWRGGKRGFERERRKYARAVKTPSAV